MKPMRPYGRVAVLVLAGGRGERLDLLTTLRAKPAVPFGGNFRIIDFVLSNCFHSGLTEVSILTQYLPRSLEDHIRFGRDWDLDRISGGLQYLHPHRGLERSNWYGGTANALYENLGVLEESRADHFLILSGDHIYRMDYRELVAQHEASMVQATVAVRPVDPAQAHQFGIFEKDERDRVIGFAEKPAQPRSNLASMGIYVIRRQFLLDALRSRGAAEPALDFGRDLVPSWVAAGELALYAFPGYWLDVGTLETYVQAHQDLLGAEPRFQLADPDWPVITHTPPRAPMQLADGARVLDALVSEGCRIEGRVERSVLGPGVHVAAGAVVRDAVVMEDSRIGPGCRVERCVVDKRVELGAGCQVGGEGAGACNEEKPQVLRAGFSLLAKDSRVPPGWLLGRNVRWGLCDEPAAALARYPDRRVPDGASCLAD
jgi:glucose-1-phosphate adenylyltransferase